MRLPSILLLLSAVTLCNCGAIDDMLVGGKIRKNGPIMQTSAYSGGNTTGSSTSVQQIETLGSRERSVSGAVSQEAVIDGDTLVLKGVRIRLHGIDAPELKQSCRISGTDVACGQIARHALIGFVSGIGIRCEHKDIDRYGRHVSRCLAGDLDLSAAMVRTGFALAYRKYSNDYIADEKHAKALGRGVWKGSFVEPWDWRLQRSQ